MRLLGVFVSLALCCAMSLGFAPARAAAQDDAAYRSIVREALSEFDAGNFEEALTLFQQAYALRPSARVLRGIAKVQFELRRYVECLDACDQALASTLDPLTPEMTTEITELRERASRFVGTLVVNVEPATATVLLDGHELAPAQIGTPLRLAMGSHTLEASAAEHQPTHRTIEVTGGATTDASLTLEPVPAVVIAPPPPPPPAPPPRAPDSTFLIAGGVTAGVGLVAFSAGLGWLINRIEAVDYCNGSPAFGAICRNGTTVTGERDAALAPVILGGAALLTGAALIVVHFVTQPGDESQAAALCVPMIDGVMCSGGARW